MKLKKIKNVNAHMVAYEGHSPLSEKVNEFFAAIVKFRLDSLNLSNQQKIKILDNVLFHLKN